ncbi:skin secretory protein xP2-like isoform X1 [Felis catus]|uniref:skin secretory protein xP2-like isoform X1 n=1 Tax=Felis catus TaxID=9685 RepID=UPI001D19E968|nr:skin secretory protein xP2-like isoform X1 [Felis catus]XP_044892418.1 skin secretory protein xP2-like isoform X1 [Felis catus]
MPGGQAMLTLQVKAGWEGQSVLGWPSCPQDSSRACRWMSLCPGRRAVRTQKSTDEIGRRLSGSRFTCPTEVCVCPVAQEGHPGPGERVAARRSPEAGPGDGLGGPPSPPGPLHRVLAQRSWDQDPEPPEPEPEESGAGAEAGAAPEPDPTASGASAALEAGVASGATPAGARQPAGDLGPVRGQRAPGQSQLGPASAPAASTVPASAPNTVPATALLPAPATSLLPAPAPAPATALLPAPATALAPTWMPATDQGPEGLHGMFVLFLIVPIPDPDTLPQCLFLFSLILSLLFFLAVTLFLHCWFIIHINPQ